MTKFTVIDPATNLPYCADPDALALARGACVVAPPGQDFTALATSQLIYGGDDGGVANINMRDMAAIFGHTRAGIIVPFPYRTGLILQGVMPLTKHWRARIHVPALQAPISRVIKCVSYYLPGHRLPDGWQAHTVRAAIVPADADWSAATDLGSYRAGVAFQDQMLMQFTVGQAASTSRAELVAGRDYDFLFAFDNPAYAGGYVLSIN